VDIFEELAGLLKQRYKPILLSPTYEELLKMAEKGSPKMRQQVSVALKLTEKCHLVDVEKQVSEINDDVIVRVASEWKCPVATNDGELRKRLRHINVPVIYLRQKSRLEMDGGMH
jgi:rRNA-processing protein FCF1